MVIPADCAAVTISAAEPVMVATSVASTATEVLPSTLFRLEAAADASVTVTVSALLPLASTKDVNVARSPSLTVAVITPVVRPSRVI